MAYYCSKHSINHSSLDCPRCAVEQRHDELIEQARASHEETLAAARESDYRQANPGNYECPSCLYVTLKRGASRCPACHADTPADHWLPIFERERKRAEEQERLKRVAAEEWARGEPERLRRAKVAAEAAARAVSAKQRAAFLDTAALVYFGYLLPIFGWVTALIILAISDPNRFTIGSVLIFAFVPVVNWIFYLLLLLFNANERPLALTTLIVWTVAGGFAYLAARTTIRT